MVHFYNVYYFLVVNWEIYFLYFLVSVVISSHWLELFAWKKKKGRKKCLKKLCLPNSCISDIIQPFRRTIRCKKEQVDMAQCLQMKLSWKRWWQNRWKIFAGNFSLYSPLVHSNFYLWGVSMVNRKTFKREFGMEMRTGVG